MCTRQTKIRGILQHFYLCFISPFSTSTHFSFHANGEFFTFYSDPKRISTFFLRFVVHFFTKIFFLFTGWILSVLAFRILDPPEEAAHVLVSSRCQLGDGFLTTKLESLHATDFYSSHMLALRVGYNAATLTAQHKQQKLWNFELLFTQKREFLPLLISLPKKITSFVTNSTSIMPCFMFSCIYENIKNWKESLSWMNSIIYNIFFLFLLKTYSFYVCLFFLVLQFFLPFLLLLFLTFIVFASFVSLHRIISPNVRRHMERSSIHGLITPKKLCISCTKTTS